MEDVNTSILQLAVVSVKCCSLKKYITFLYSTVKDIFEHVSLGDSGRNRFSNWIGEWFGDTCAT